MSVIVDPAAVRRQLAAAADAMAEGPILLHTDLFRVGILGEWTDRDDLLERYRDLVVSTFAPRELALPTFNYDFCAGGEYDVEHDPCQVGDLNEHFRRRHPGERTHTPVFNFVCVRRSSVSLEPVRNVFGPASAFAAIARGGTVAFLGAPFESNTFLHHVEELHGIGYRYPKRFAGRIRTAGGTRPLEITYRVRPPVKDAAGYDWERLVRDLERDGILRRARLGNGEILWYPAAALRDRWLERMADDELYLLTDPSRRVVADLRARRGWPLTFEAIEGDATEADPAAAPGGAA